MQIFPFLAIAVPQKLILAGTTLEFCVTTLSFLGYLLISAKIVHNSGRNYIRNFGITALRISYGIKT
ncbi:hypothetical protein GLOIN_2v1538347 [Rhizophagus irregularis DAOM 181602=DAOM 197198]|nr:hypothetical protein GLOIN_2v1538347 [Rhizophagus irregularis DAOM 181602=DAOM 197198]